MREAPKFFQYFMKKLEEKKFLKWKSWGKIDDQGSVNVFHFLFFHPFIFIKKSFPPLKLYSITLLEGRQMHSLYQTEPETSSPGESRIQDIRVI